ncbi:unnamed protein product, partial [marine sediment metagenome]
DAVCIRTGTDATFTPSLRIVGDLDMRAKIAADDWTPAVPDVIISKWGAVDSYFLRIDATTGNLKLYVNDGASSNVASSVTTGVTDGDAAEIRTAWDNAANQVTYYVDDVQLGIVRTLTAGALIAGSEPVLIGARDGGNVGMLAGDIYYAEIRDGIDGPVVLQVTPQGAPAGAIPNLSTWEGPDGRTWTSHGGVVNFPADTGGYFTLPGTAGNYIDTPDVNLLDADTAHLYQSVGEW